MPGAGRCVSSTVPPEAHAGVCHYPTVPGGRRHAGHVGAVVFVGVYAIGNPIDVLISPEATQDIRAATIPRYGLDLPLWQQYFVFLGRLLHGDLGRSFIFNMPVLD